ncbi:Polyamine oxidase 1 [Linum perenne]
MAMALVLLLFPLLFSLTTAAVSPSVIVIGAGMSGISAAKKLYDAGIKDILILEATSRIGGRMLKTEFSGYTVEMGANWFFSGGPVANPIIEMAKKVNLRSYPNDYSNITANTYKQEGGMYLKKEVDQVDEVAVARDDYCANFARILSRKSNKKDVDVSILAAQRIYGRPPLTPLEMVIDFYHNDYEDAEPPKVTSLKHTYPRTEFEEHGEDPHFVTDPRGFGVLVQYLASQILKKGSPVRLKLNKLCLSQVVTEIVYAKNSVSVKTEDGSTYSANYAIVSASVGVLQTDLIKFKPKLPMWKRIAISDMTMTIYTKIFMKFPHKFWPSGNGTEFFLYSHVQRGYYPLWQHLENEYPGSNILMVTVTADESRRIEQLTNEAIQGEAMAVLKKMFGEKIPNPVNILVPRWGSHRFYKGSYANWPANYNQEKHDQLGAAVGAVYFTGEHNSNKFIGYVDGAYLEGIISSLQYILSWWLELYHMKLKWL